MFKNGQMVHKDGVNGIVVDAHIRKSGQYKGKISVAFVGNRYGTEAIEPGNIKEGWIV